MALADNLIMTGYSAGHLIRGIGRGVSLQQVGIYDGRC